MKTENGLENVDNPASITGDVIGDTAYSERFVLKILLKLANRDTLKEEVREQPFEDELCTLWEMSAEKDVVLYLQKHDTLKLFTFALPVIESPRIIELIIGTIANMCCHQEVVDTFMANNDLLKLLMDFLKSDDSQILNQVLRLICSCLYDAEGDKLSFWMNTFTAYEYANIIYFILTNSTNKELLMTAFENINTIFVSCQNDGSESVFADTFATADAPAAVYAGYCEYQKLACSEESLDRLHIITVTLMLNFITRNQVINEEPVNNVNVAMNESTENGVNLIRDILLSYESKMIEYYKVESVEGEFCAVLEAITILIESLELSRVCSPDKYFSPSYKLWKVLTPNGREDKNELLKGFMDDLKNSLGSIMCTYMAQCTDENLLYVLDEIGDNYGNIVSQISNVELQATIANRALNFRNRINENVDA